MQETKAFVLMRFLCVSFEFMERTILKDLKFCWTQNNFVRSSKSFCRNLKNNEQKALIF